MIREHDDAAPPAGVVARWDEREESTGDLATRCAEETRRFLARIPYTDRYCFALFRRALAERDDAAWQALYSCYERLVRGWAGRAAADPDADALVSEAFERLWMAVDDEKFARFSDVRGLLQYLKLCVRAAVLDQRRAAARQSLDIRLDRDADDEESGRGIEVASRDDVEGETLDQASRQEFWETVRRHLRDSQEVLLVRLSFVEGVPPREICRREPEHFPTVGDVYRIKRNVLDRLRRSADVREFAGVQERPATTPLRAGERSRQ